MSVRCGCARCTIGGFTWPLVLITLGALILIDRANITYGFGTLWPVLLIVIGLVKIAEALAPAEGHVGR